MSLAVGDRDQVRRNIGADIGGRAVALAASRAKSAATPAPIWLNASSLGNTDNSRCLLWKTLIALREDTSIAPVTRTYMHGRISLDSAPILPHETKGLSNRWWNWIPRRRRVHDP